MQVRPRRRSLCAALLAVAVLSGCSSLPRLPRLHFDSPFGNGRWVEFRDGVVIASPTPALAGNFVNLTDDRLGLRVEIDEIEGDDDCANSFSLAPRETRPYACPQKFVAAGKRFRVDLRVYDDLGDTNLVERVQRLVVLEPGEDGGLVLDGRPLE